MIPGTATSEVRCLWVRQPDHNGMRVYHAKSGKGFLVACVSRDPAGKDGAPLWHISISHRDQNNQPDRCPIWDEMKSAKYQLIPDDVPMVLIFPRRTVDYVDMYPTCLHLWESTEPDIDR